jgi:tRNA A58 N-methylase Trm61
LGFYNNLYEKSTRNLCGELHSRELDEEKYQGASKNFGTWGIVDDIYYYNESYDTYFDNPIEFDLLYIDVHNEGQRIKKILDNEFIQDMIKKGKHILFEGGSDSRDRIAESRNGMSFKTIERDYELVYGNQNDRHTFSRLC